MLILGNTTTSLEMKLAGTVTANELEFASFYADGTTSAVTPANTTGTSNGTTAVTVVAAPGASAQRQIFAIHIYNKDTASATVTLQINSNSTLTILCKVPLAAGETLQLDKNGLFQVLDANGNIRIRWGDHNHDTSYQPLDSDLTALAGLTTTGLVERTGSGTAATVTITNAGKALLDDATAADQLATLGGAPLASPALTGTPTAPTAATNTNTTQVATTAFVKNQGYALPEIGQNIQNANYTLVLEDAGKHILHPAADNNARTFTIPANASVAYPIGTTLMFINKINTITIAINADTLTMAGAGTTGSRTLAANGLATAVKITSTEWMISGTGVS